MSVYYPLNNAVEGSGTYTFMVCGIWARRHGGRRDPNRRRSSQFRHRIKSVNKAQESIDSGKQRDTIHTI